MASDPPETDQSVRHTHHARLRRACPDLAVSVDHTVSGRHRSPDGLPGGTNNESSTLWAMPLMAPVFAEGHLTPATTDGYDLMPTHVARSFDPSVLPGLGATN